MLQGIKGSPENPIARDHWNFGFGWSAALADDSQFLARENTHILNTG
jgi:hypothetical protein